MTTTAFVGVRLFDGVEVWDEATVVVEGELVVAVGEGIDVPPAATVVEGDGRTLLPGLIDCHVHAWGDGLQRALVHGVTTVLDMFSDARWAEAMRLEQRQGSVPDRADLFSAGTAVTAPGGHCTQFGLSIPTLAEGDDADSFVAARVDEGSDWIKVIVEGGAAWGLPRPTLSAAQVAAVASAAQKRGKLAVAHIGTQDEALMAIRQGCDGLAHAFVDRPLDDALVSEMAERNAFVIPTLTVLESAATGIAGGVELLDDPDVVAHLRPGDERNLRSAFSGASHLSHQWALDAVAALHQAGVAVLCGSDAPNPGTTHGASTHRELSLLVAAGLTPVDALRAATSIPAGIFGLADRGFVKTGMRADLLLVRGDPTVDIRATRAVEGVWKGGTRVDREADRAAVAAERAAALERRSAAPPTGSESGRISDFESGEAVAAFGAGLTPSTDAMVGGTSTIELTVVDDGAAGTQKSLLVTGVLGAGAITWSGVLFAPGARPFAAANLSAWRHLSFWLKGDGRPCRIVAFTEQMGAMPAGVQTVMTTGEWRQHEVSFLSLGTDGSDVSGLLFTGHGEPGSFRFQIDELQLRS